LPDDGPDSGARTSIEMKQKIKTFNPSHKQLKK